MLGFVSHLLFYTPGWRETQWSKIPYPRKQRDGQDLNTRLPDLEFEVLTDCNLLYGADTSKLYASNVHYSETPLIWWPMGQKIWLYLWVTLLTRVFFTRKCRVVLPGAKKSYRNNEVIDYHHKAGFHCRCIRAFLLKSVKLIILASLPANQYIIIKAFKQHETEFPQFFV